MLVYKDGITRTIDDCDWQKYKEIGFTAEVNEPQPTQEAIEAIDDYTVKPVVAKKKGKKGV